jgi:DNA-binding GntR family transcriptional regulator
MKPVDEIYKAIRDEIFGGNLNPGERLIEKELCERLGTSRGYVREALKMLSTDGFIVINRGKGATVTKISYQDTKNLYELLAVLEARSVELAAPHLTEKDLEELLTINQKMRGCINAKDRANARRIWQEANLRFHGLFAEKSGNQELRTLVESIRLRTFDFRYVVLFEPYYPLFADQHESLILEIKNKSFKKVRKIMETHINKASEVVLRSLKNVPGFYPGLSGSKPEAKNEIPEMVKSHY